MQYSFYCSNRDLGFIVKNSIDFQCIERTIFVLFTLKCYITVTCSFNNFMPKNMMCFKVLTFHVRDRSMTSTTPRSKATIKYHCYYRYYRYSSCTFLSAVQKITRNTSNKLLCQNIKK